VTIYRLVPRWVRRVKRVRAKDEEGRPKLDQSGRPVMTQGEEEDAGPSGQHRVA